MMSSEALLEAARKGEAWSLGAVCAHLSDTLDDEGRPLLERRATSRARRDVPFDVAFCAYGDERDGRLMNRSALEQISSHLKSVVRDISALQTRLDEARPSWEGMLLCVLDQYLQPGVQLLVHGDMPIPAAKAVGHKVAAGYLGVLRRLFVARAKGRELEPTSSSFRAFLRETGGLIGASEACAGPPKQIAYLSALLLGDAPEPAGATGDDRAYARRIEIARALSRQLRLGIAWELFDRECEHALLVAPSAALTLEPRNDFIGCKLDERRRLLARQEPISPAAAARAIPDDLPTEDRARVANAFSSGPGEPGHDWLRGAVAAALEHGDGALFLREGPQIDRLARALSRYIVRRHELVAVQHHLEATIRRSLGVSLEAPVELAPMVLPRSHTMPWFEAILGHRIEYVEGGELTVRFANHHRRSSAVARGG